MERGGKGVAPSAPISGDTAVVPRKRLLSCLLVSRFDWRRATKESAPPWAAISASAACCSMAGKMGALALAEGLRGRLRGALPAWLSESLPGSFGTAAGAASWPSSMTTCGGAGGAAGPRGGGSSGDSAASRGGEAARPVSAAGAGARVAMAGEGPAAGALVALGVLAGLATFALVAALARGWVGAV